MGSSIFKNQNSNQLGDLANRAKAMQNVMGMLS